jgi:class 3 adenylate cyclase/tetratricopeptide (TPR) repeat protein
MSTTLDEQINQLKQAIVELEAQRSILGDEAVDAALVPSRQKLAELEAQVEPSREEPPALPTRQRKLVTLLYMDVVGSTAMTQHLDPEDTLEIMDNALPRLAAPIETHGGHVTRYTGDGFKAVFGDPIAREDDPEQAIRAGLEIIEGAESFAKELQTEWEIEDFKVRIGIDTGLAALGGQTEAEDTVMGRVVNRAVRIESAAPPGGLLISHETYRHVRGVFTIEPQDPIMAKGFPKPVSVYLVKDIKPRAFRVQTRGVEGIETRMVGRHDELKFLQDALLTIIEEGEGQVVTISGEAGVGKSRLLYEYQNWFELLPQVLHLFHGRGRQGSRGQPYSLLRDLFTFRFQVLENDSGEEARRKIVAGFGDVFGNDEDALMRAHIIGQLLGFDFSASPHLKGMLNDPEQLRNRGLMYLREYFRVVSMDNPCLITLEDIHWSDDSSLDMFNQLGEGTPQQRLLIVYATRPTLFEQRIYWGEGQTYHTRLELRSLSKRESRQLVAEILKLVEDIPAELRELVVSGAEGNPFYLEELIKMLIEDGVVVTGSETWHIQAERLAQIDVPSTLAGVLQARLDSLPQQERIVLQQASVVGRLFWDRLVAHIQAEHDEGSDPQFVAIALTSLRGRELIYRREESAFAGALEYLFKNDILREVTYESVIKHMRKTYHELVAEWLITNSGDRIGEYSGPIAEHLLLAGRKDLAGEYFAQAGESALASYANAEAESFYSQALSLTDQPAAQLDAYLGLGRAFMLQDDHKAATAVIQQGLHLAERYGDVARRDRLLYAQAQNASRQHRSDGGKPEVEAALLAAEQAGDDYHLAQNLLLLTEVHESIGDLSSALETATRAQIVSSKLNDNQLEARILVELGFLRAQRADFDEAVVAAEQGLRLLAKTDDRSAIAYAWNILGRALGGRGNYSRALDAFNHSQEEAQIIGDRYLLAQAFNMRGWLHCELGDYENGLKFDEEGVDLARQWGKPSPEISARLNVCLDVLHLGDPLRVLAMLDEIEVQIKGGSFGFHNWRWRLRLLHTRGLCFLALDEPAKALAMAEEGLLLAETAIIRKYVALNHEMKGAAMAELGKMDDAISELKTAISLADAIQYQPIRWAGRHQLAKLYYQNGLEQEAKNTSSKAEHIIQTIAAALDEKTLQTSFLNAALP